MLGFDDYADISARLRRVLAGERHEAHVPRDRRTLLPMTPVAARRGVARGRRPGHGSTVDEHTPAHLRRVLRRRLERGPVASLKIASGCDRRCSFCAIPSFRGSFVSRTPDEVLAEAEWLARDGVRELVLVSENSTSYGKDLGDPRALEKLLPQLAAVDGHRPGPGELPAAGRDPPRSGRGDRHHAGRRAVLRPVLPALQRAGAAPHAPVRLDRAVPRPARARCARSAPEAGARSNVIVGFPGETRADVAELERFLTEARLDAIGVFDYSDEDGTEAARPGRQGQPRPRSRGGTRGSARWPRSCATSGPRSGSAREVEVLVESRRRRRRRGAGGPPGPGGRRLHHAGRRRWPCGSAIWSGRGHRRPTGSTSSPYPSRSRSARAAGRAMC